MTPKPITTSIREGQEPPPLPTCKTCGRPREKVHRKDGKPETICRPCHATRAATRRAAARVAAETPDAPPICPKCDRLKTAERGSNYLRGYRWVCYPCLAAAKKVGRENKPVVIPARPKPAKLKRPRSPIQAAICEYWAAERRQREPVTCPSKAGKSLQGRKPAVPIPRLLGGKSGG